MEMGNGKWKRGRGKVYWRKANGKGESVKEKDEQVKRKRASSKGPSGKREREKWEMGNGK